MKSITGKNYTKLSKKPFASGTYGKLYNIKNNEDNKIYAYKFFKKDDQEIVLGVLREISILKLLQGNSHYTIDILDIIIRNENIGIVTKKYDYDLATCIDKKITMSKKERYNITCKTSEALYFLHTNGIIHRDIKPENILLEKFEPVLIDFSLSKMFTQFCYEGTHTSNVCTSSYRAPEIVNKKRYDFKSDVWSLGVVFFELFTYNRISFVEDKDAVNFLLKKVDDFRSNSLGKMMKGMLNKNPKKRWNMKELLTCEFINIEPNIPIVWSGTIVCEISNEVEELCIQMNAKKYITRVAAQTYLNKTGCSEDSAVELACKFYETELPNYENEYYADEELEIFKKMDFNLFV